MAATVFFESASELATVRNIFKVNALATDPSTVSLTVTDPTQAAVTYTFAAGQITRNAVGDYQKDIACPIDGEWTFEWAGTGTASDVVAGTWTVFETALGKLYPTVDALKSRLGIGASDAVDEYELHTACFAASRALEQYCERTFWRTPTGTVRTFVPDDHYHLRLPEFCDLVSVATLKTDPDGDGVFETTWAASDYQLLPQNPAAAPEQRPYTKIRAVGAQLFPYPHRTGRQDRVEVTGVYGWPAVPMGVKQAALLLAAETFKLKDAPFGVAGFGEFGAVRVRANPMVTYYADPYRRIAALVK